MGPQNLTTQTSTGRHWQIRSIVSTNSLEEDGFCWELSAEMQHDGGTLLSHTVTHQILDE